MKILGNELNRLKKKSAKRVGRGISAGGGKTAGRGTKGQKSRAGHNIPKQFEGGQSNLSLRLPKIKGFKGRTSRVVEITLTQLSDLFKDGDTIDIVALKKAGLAKEGQIPKILANGEINKNVIIESINISAAALKMISEATKKSAASKKESEDSKPAKAEAEAKTSKAKPAPKKATSKSSAK